MKLSKVQFNLQKLKNNLKKSVTLNCKELTSVLINENLAVLKNNKLVLKNVSDILITEPVSVKKPEITKFE